MRNKVLVVNLGRQYGGVEKVCENIVKSIDESNFQLYVLCIKNSMFHKEILKITSRVLALPRKKWLSLLYVPLTMIYILKNNIKILHCHGVFSSIIGSICGFLLRKPIMTTLHGVVDLERNNSMKGKVFKVIEDKLLYFNRFYICVSNYLKNIIEKRVGESTKVRVIYNSININNNLFKYQHVDNLNSKTPILLCSVGRLEEIKGHWYLIQAVQQLLAEGYNVILHIAGEGSLKPQYEKYIRDHDLCPYIKLWGFVEKPMEFISKHQIFVNPSLMETFGLSVVEALGVGMPLIATKVGAIPEIIQNEYNGLLIDSENVEQLKMGLKAIIDDTKLRRRLAINAELSFKENFSVNRMVDSYIDMYLSIIEERSGNYGAKDSISKY